MSTFDHIVQKGIEQGIEQGIQQGIEQGIQQGIEQGIEQGAEIFRREAIPKLLNLNKLTIEEIAFVTASPVSYVKDLHNNLIADGERVPDYLKNTTTSSAN
jgi:flagellar biosynthesis/type III secretory pathway protein FliH